MNVKSARRARAGWWVAGLLALPQVQAQTAGADAVELDAVEVVGDKAETLANAGTTATKMDLTVLETPQAVTVIPRVTVDDFNLDTLNEVLELTPGVTVESVETDRTYFTARGFDITNFNIDGFGMPLAFGIATSDIDMALYDRVEVIRGANGLASGVGNPSATVNLVRKRPTAEPGGRFSLSYGDWDTVRVDADVSLSLAERVGARFVAAYEDGDSWLERYGKTRSVAYGVFDFELSPATLLTLGASWQDSEADSPLWGALPLFYDVVRTEEIDGVDTIVETLERRPTDYDRETATSADWAYWNNERIDVFADFEHQLASDWLLRVYATHTQAEGESALFYMYNLPYVDVDSGDWDSAAASLDPARSAAGLTGYPSLYTDDVTRSTANVALMGDFLLGGRRHDAVIGATWGASETEATSLYDYDVLGFPPIGDLAEWDGDTGVQPVFDDGRTGSDFEDEELSAYGALRIRPAQRVSLIAGLRAVGWESSGYSYGARQDADDDAVLPYTGVLFEVADDVSLYASYAETFTPQVEYGADGQRLEPKEGSNLEGGIKAGFFDERLIASATVFSAEYDNEAVSVGFNPDTGQTIYAGFDYESQGYELELTGEISADWHVILGWTDLSIDGPDGERARAFVPEQLLKLATTYRLPQRPEVKLGAQMKWQSETGFMQPDGAFLEVQDAYAVLSAFASWQVTEQLSLQLNGNNLTDEKYWNSLYWDQAYWAAPRNFTGTVTWRY